MLLTTTEGQEHVLRWTLQLPMSYDFCFLQSSSLDQQQQHQTIDERLNKAIRTVLVPAVNHGQLKHFASSGSDNVMVTDEQLCSFV